MIKKLFRLLIVFILILSEIPIGYSLNVENVSYSNVDHKVIDEFNINEWTPIIVRLFDDSNLSLNSDIEANWEIYGARADYYNQIEDNVLSTLSKNEFILKFKFSVINGFAGYITKSGLDKLANNPRVVWL